MNARTLERTALAGLLLGAIALTAGPAVGDAQANPRHRSKAKVVHRHGPACGHVHAPPRVVHPRDRWAAPARHHRPWHAGARRILVGDAPYFYHADFGVYLGGLALNVTVGSRAPRGYAYYDPYCGETFWTLDEYRRHRTGRWGGRAAHPPALHLVVVDRGRGGGNYGWCGN